MYRIPDGLALIFDMDGVLIDSNPMHAAAWIDYLRPFGISPLAFSQQMQGKRNDELVRRLFGEHLSEEEVFAHGARKEALYRQRMAPVIEQHLMPGLRDFLQANPAVPKGLGSNAEPANVAFLLEGAALHGHFQAVVDGHQVARPKPAPDIYQKVMQGLGVQPEATIVFEDSPSGIRAARDAGARVVGVNREGEPLPHVDVTIRDFQDPRLGTWIEETLGKGGRH